MPPRVHIASDDPSFDSSLISLLRSEGFSTTYIPLLPPKGSSKIDLTPLRHIADDLEIGESYALLAFGAAATAALDFYASPQPHVCALVAYYPAAIANPKAIFPPSLQVLTHLAASQSFAPAWTSYTYGAGAEPGFAEADLDEYDAVAASLSWSRTLAVLRRAFKQDASVELEGVREAHKRAGFGGSAAEVVRNMTTGSEAPPEVNYLPTLAGGVGQRDLFVFYRDYFLGALPPSAKLKLLSRTIGSDRVVDEFVLSFKHTAQIPWLLPGVPPSQKQVSFPLVSVVTVRGGKLAQENVYWDQAGVLVQIGLLDPKVVPGNWKEKGVERLPVVGVEQARKAGGIGNVESNGLLGGWDERRKGDPGVKVDLPERPKQAKSGA